VDNNSSDGSKEFLQAKFQNIDYIFLNQNLGFGKANNVGIKKAKGKYILLLNPDTLLSKDTLSNLYQYMEQNTDVGISTCKILNGDGTFQESCRRGFPTPLAAFSKLFGIQKFFPNSKVLGKYNLTYLGENETVEVDAISGSFMFFRGDLLKKISGFDEDFFMYGEDLDICYRVKKLNYRIMYVPDTSTIHYKGESTKRSNINDIKVFFDAMQIFVKKHYSKSFFFMSFLRFGIFLRAIISYLLRYKRDYSLIIADIFYLIIGLLLGSNIVFGKYFGFPDYAYPIVFILPPAFLIIIMILIGEYFENKHSVSGAFFAYTILFMSLSTLTYFFPDYRFSRGTLLFMTGFSIIGSTFLRILIMLFDKYKGDKQFNNILIIGNESTYKNIINEFGAINPGSFHIKGFVFDNPTLSNTDWLGTPEHLDSIVNQNSINNIIISDKKWNFDSLKHYLKSSYGNKLKFHFVSQYSDFIVSQIISDVINNSANIANYKYSLLRYKIIKRTFDIIFSFIILLSASPFLAMTNKGKNRIKSIYNVFLGKITFVGIIPDGIFVNNYKPGLINFRNINKNKNYDKQTIDKLNEFYLKNYSISLDFDILLRKILGK
jgi:GT2 family glycosyltransferase